jgi:hypothetical protein
VVGARGAAGTQCAERGPVNLHFGGTESERGCTFKALVGFIGAGTGVGVARRGVGRRAARRVRGRVPGRALALPEHVEHVVVYVCPGSSSC